RDGVGHARTARLHEEPMKSEALEVARLVHEAGPREEGHEAGRDGQRRAEAERAQVRERGPGEQHVAEGARMDDQTVWQAVRGHAGARLRGARPGRPARQRGARERATRRKAVSPAHQPVSAPPTPTDRKCALSTIREAPTRDAAASTKPRRRAGAHPARAAATAK